MNPLDREDLNRRLQRNMDPKQKTGVSGSIEILPETDGAWNNSDAKSTLRSKGLSDSITKEPEEEDPDGEACDMDEDPELTRKKQELKEIRELILRKKAALVKNVVPVVKCTSPPGSSMPATCKGPTLKDRVKVILEQRPPVSSLSMVQSPINRVNSSSPSNKDLLQEDHPLKLRVKSLMRNREVPDVTLPLPMQSDTSLVMEENSNNQGFERFLTVLNKGVDMEMLSRIVNDDDEYIPLETARSESQGSNSGTSLLGRSQTNNGERNSNPPSQERSLNFHLPHKSQNSDRLDLRVGSCSRSRSPSPVKKKKKEEEENPKVTEQHEQLQNILNSLGFSLEEEEMTKLAKRTQERLYGKQNEDMKADSRREQMSPQKGSHKPYRSSLSPSSSSSSSSSSTSMSRSTIPSPSHRQRSHSRDSRQRGTSDRSGSIDRSRGGQTSQDDNQDSSETAKHRDRDEDAKEFKETSTYHHTYPQTQIAPRPPPAEFSAFPNYRLSQSSQYYDSRCGSYSAATVSYWTYTQNGIPPPPDPRFYPYAQNSYHPFPAPAVAPKMFQHGHTPLKDNYLLVNPDLSECEGQTGSVYGPRCLSNVKIKQTKAQQWLKKRQKASTAGANSNRNNNFNNVHQSSQRQKKKQKGGKQKMKTKVLADPNLSSSKGQDGLLGPPPCTQVSGTVQTKPPSMKKKRSKGNKRNQLRSNRKRKRMAKEAAAAAAATAATYPSASAVGKVAAPHRNDSNAKQSGGDKQPLTEKQIKAKLRKQRKAFNRKAKRQNQTVPANAQTSQDSFRPVGEPGQNMWISF